MKLVIAFILVGVAAAATVNNQKLVNVDTSVFADEKPLKDDTSVFADEKPVNIDTSVFTDDKRIVVDTPVSVDEKPVVVDDTITDQDESSMLDNIPPVVLTETDERIFEHPDIGMIIVPESVFEELNLREANSINTVRVINTVNTDTDEMPINTVHFAENTGFVPISTRSNSVKTVRDINTVNTDTDEMPINTVHFVNFAENTGLEPISVGELESVRVLQEEVPFEGLFPGTVHVVDLPIFENLPRRYPGPIWR